MRKKDHETLEQLLSTYPLAEVLNRMGIICRINSLRTESPMRRMHWKSAAYKVEEAAAALRAAQGS